VERALPVTAFDVHILTSPKEDTVKGRILSGRLLTVAILIATAVFGGGLTPSAANATTYYTAKTGSDNNSCTSAQSTSTPKLTIKSGLGCLKAGDTLSIRAGTYNETINTQQQTVPTGTSWSTPVTIAAYPGETVTLQPSGFAVVQIIGNGWKYIIFDRLIFDAISVENRAIDLDGLNQAGAGYIRFTNCEIKNGPGSGVMTGRGSNFNEFINCKIHDNSTQSLNSHGFYIQSSNNLFDNCEIYNNRAYGLHIYNGYSGQRANNNIVRNTRAYNNSTNSSHAAGILIGSGDGNMAYNNIAYGQPVGIMVGFNYSTNSKVYNNTVYNNRTDGIQIRASSSTATVTNNTAYSNGTNVNNYSSGTTLSNNH
jgi:parallel beta-helix repeat protein